MTPLERAKLLKGVSPEQVHRAENFAAAAASLSCQEAIEDGATIEQAMRLGNYTMDKVLRRYLTAPPPAA